MIKSDIIEQFQKLVSDSSHITILTGAGVSSESGIPTFRGSEGYWRIGSINYQPQEIATYSMFSKMPLEVWSWYIFRRGVCLSASPNSGHLALARMESTLKDKFTLITQNIDGLHLKAGNSPGRTIQIHGNINYMRCREECSEDIYPVPEDIPSVTRGEKLTENAYRSLKCPKCGSPARPHVLLWDEIYNEVHYRLESALETAEKTDLLIVAGTTGATNLPNRIVDLVFRRGGTIIDINIEKSRFSHCPEASDRGFFIKGKSGSILPILSDIAEKSLS